MSYKTATVVLASAVAQNGTFTVGYPTDTTAGSFASYGHYLMAHGHGGAKYSQDLAQMSVSFDATEITVTYKGATSIPASTSVVCQFNMAGQDDREQSSSHALDRMKRMAMDPIVEINLGAPDAADPNGIVESQDLTAAGVYSVLAFNGVYGDPYNNEYAVLDVPRTIDADWTGTAVITITGEDEYGDVIVESSASGTSHDGTKAFKKVTDISVSANVTSLTVGTLDVLGLPVFVENAAQIMLELEDGVPIQKEPAVVRIPFQIDETDLLAGTPISVYCPVDGTIDSVTTIAWKAVTTGDSITMKVNNTSVDGLAVVVADASAAGDVDTDAPTAGHASTAVSVGDELELIPGASFATAGAVTGFIQVSLTAAQQLDGTFVAGVQTAPTATTGDVKGTYDPTTACDGSASFTLIARLPDPIYKGVDNYDG